MSETTDLLDGVQGTVSDIAGEVVSRLYAELRDGLLTDFNSLPPNILDVAREVRGRMLSTPGAKQYFGRLFVACAVKAMHLVVLERFRRQAFRAGIDTSVQANAAAVGDDFEGHLPIDALESALVLLERIDKRCYMIAEMRYFAGLSIVKISDMLGLPPDVTLREWTKAHVFIHEILAQHTTQ